MTLIGRNNAGSNDDDNNNNESTKVLNPRCIYYYRLYRCYYMHTVKCVCSHSATEAMVTAYSKEFSNESCREA